MDYKVNAGLEIRDLPAWLKHAKLRFGCFDDGRVNYTQADIAPIVMCTVIYKSQLLLVKRSFGLADAEGYWSTVNGFVDEIKPIKEVVKLELKEELGVTINTSAVAIGPSYTLENPKEKRRYIVFPCLITLKAQPTIILDREHTEFVWIDRKKLENYDILDDLPYAIDAALKLSTYKTSL